MLNEHKKTLIQAYIEGLDLRNIWIVESEFFKEYQNKYDAFFVSAVDRSGNTWVFLIVFNGDIDEENNMYIEQIIPIM